MGNHLRELIEQVERNEHEMPLAVGETERAVAKVTLLGYSAQAMCFDLGELAELGVVAPAELAYLPYPVCWLEHRVEWDEGDVPAVGAFAYRVNDAEGERVVLWVWVRLEKTWRYLGTEHFYPGRSSGDQFHWDDETFTPGEDGGFWGSFDHRCLVRREARRLLVAIAVMNCSNIVTRRHDPDPKLQKARAKRGKQPLFSYHTLEIDPASSREAGVDQGGTHASPRVHLRRGHIRKFAPGKWCWVRETIVRGITPGMVHKDYALKGAVH